MRPFASYDWFCGPGQPPERRLGAVRERLALAYSTLPKLDSWRGGYDAVVAWAPAANGSELEVVEEMARNWPDRALVLVDRDVAAARGDVISAWEAAGLKVIAFVTGPGWERTAAVLARRAWSNLVA